METAELIMVTSQNNNKFYSMQEDNDGYFTVKYGRVGAGCQTVRYPMSKWKAKYQEKIRKGYKDVTELRANTSTDDDISGYKPIADKSVSSLIKELLSRARNAIRKNYLVSATVVTQTMISEAQAILDALSATHSMRTFNDRLLELFQVIPRSMSQVSDYLATKKEDMPKIIQREQELLDTMAGQVQTHAVQRGSGDNSDKTILEANGLTIKPATEKDKEIIRKLLGGEAPKLDDAWVVENQAIQTRYEEHMAERPIQKTLLWHGSRTENWWSILRSGLKLRPTNAIINGKMFGHGIYFAPSAKKSLGYTSMQSSYWAHGADNHGYMAVMEVATGKPLDIYRWSPADGGLNLEELHHRDPRADSVYAHKGESLKNDEIVVYDEAQITIKYLVRLH